MAKIPDPRFELQRITPTEWLIHDLRYRKNDPRRTVACVYRAADTEVEVVWLRKLPLATSYTTPFDVLDDVLRFHRKDRRSRPVPIPHLAPPPMPRTTQPA